MVTAVSSTEEQERTYQHLFMYAWATKKQLAAASGGRQWFNEYHDDCSYVRSKQADFIQDFPRLHIPVEVMNFRVLHAGKLVIHLV